MSEKESEKAEEKRCLIAMLKEALAEWNGRAQMDRFRGINFSAAEVELLLKALRRRA